MSVPVTCRRRLRLNEGHFAPGTCIRYCGQLSSFRAPDVDPLLVPRLGAANQKSIPTSPATLH
eukprot:3071392-Pyramimonas_sp.AAC.1